MQYPQSIENILSQIENFEATPTVPKTGTGARQEGRQFEDLINELWDGFATWLAEKTNADLSLTRTSTNEKYWLVEKNNRILVIPAKKLHRHVHQTTRKEETRIEEWLAKTFSVSDLVERYPGVEVLKTFAPPYGRFANEKYPKIYEGLTTRFDDTILLIDQKILHKKILFEYKTGKSSDQNKLDGNAHERLTFQMMQYLEVATKFPQCDFIVIANAAFVRYKNKYHANFRIQAERLKAFRWFFMDYLCFKQEYKKFLNVLVNWIDRTSKGSND